MKPYREAELVYEAKALIGENPLWDAQHDTIRWIDIKLGEIHALQLKSFVHTSIQVAQYIGALVPECKGRFVAALATGFYLLDETGLLRRIAEPEGLVPRLRFNDGKCDGKGRFWAGTEALFDDMRGNGMFYRLDADGRVSIALRGVTTSNGLAWNHDNTILYYIDSPKLNVMAYPFDLEAGTVGKGKLCIEIPLAHGYPDGMSIDEEGMLWVAHWGGHAVRRYDPATGVCIGIVPVPASYVTSCCFGGQQMDELFITTACEGIAAGTEPLAGALFRAYPGVRGRNAYAYQMNE